MGVALLAAPIRDLGRPISPVGLNTGSGSPYWLRQYGLLAAIARWAIRRLPGVALRSPRAVFWRPFRARVSPCRCGLEADLDTTGDVEAPARAAQ